MAQEPTKITRRQAIKLLTAATSAATLANLPHKWVKPIVQAGVLPAHAQTSPTGTATATATSTPTGTATSTPTATATQGLIQGSLEIALGWGAEVGQMNLDLEVYDPGSAQRCTPANTPTFSLAHQGDSGLGGSGSETVASGAGVVAGTFGVYLRVISTSFSENFLMFADIEITANGNNDVQSVEFNTPPADNTEIHVANVVFPAGTITWLIP